MSPSPLLQTQSSTEGQTQVIPGPETDPLLFEDYTLNPKAWDELLAAPGQSHDYCKVLFDRLGGLSVREFLQRRTSADLVFINQGITFSVYSDRRGVEKIFPFDLIPRPVAAEEWERLEAGLVQRIHALNMFLDDIYHDAASSRRAWSRQTWSSNRRATAPRWSASARRASSTSTSSAPT